MALSDIQQLYANDGFLAANDQQRQNALDEYYRTAIEQDPDNLEILNEREEVMNDFLTSAEKRAYERARQKAQEIPDFEVGDDSAIEQQIRDRKIADDEARVQEFKDQEAQLTEQNQAQDFDKQLADIMCLSRSYVMESQQSL